MKKLTIYLNLILLLSFTYLSCSSDNGRYIPPKNEDLTEAQYNKYVGLLTEAYDDNKKLTAAFQLSNLRADKKKTYKLLDQAVRDDLTNCEKIYEWYYLYDRNNFAINLLKYDTVYYKKTVLLCDELRPDYPYHKYAKAKDIEEAELEANKVVEDSTDFNMDLVRELKQIYFTDQEIRIRITQKNISEELKEELRKEATIIDSINLLKIDEIFNKYGYPSQELVGKECNFTPALVIHHSKELETRYKYLPFLEEAVSNGLLGEGTLNMIKTRIEHMELAKK